MWQFQSHFLTTKKQQDLMSSFCQFHRTKRQNHFQAWLMKKPQQQVSNYALIVDAHVSLIDTV
jgi:hypothetical protein